MLLKITRIELIDCRHQSGWNPAFVRVHTDGGIHGVGEMAPAYSSLIPAALRALESHGRGLIGEDPFQIQRITQRLLGAAWGQPDLVSGHLASAIDIALHDLKGKALGVPAYDLIGGRVRDSIRCYANGWCYNLKDPAAYAAAAAKVVADGFTALKFDPFRYAPGGFKWAYQSADGAPRQRWLRTAVDRVAAVREAVGPEVDILLEAHGKFDAPTAVAISEAMREFKLFWHEEPTNSQNVAMVVETTARNPMPVATGERLVGRHAFRPFVEARACAVLQPDLGMAGGLTECRAIAEHADLQGIFLAPHNAGGPVCTAASVHLDFATPNFLIQEIFPYRPADYFDFVESNYESRIVKGFLAAPSAPGLGIELKPLPDAARFWIE